MTDPERDGGSGFEPPSGDVRDATPPHGRSRDLPPPPPAAADSRTTDPATPAPNAGGVVNGHPNGPHGVSTNGTVNGTADGRAVLGTLKGAGPGADSTPVNDAIGARPRLNWNPVTDSGGDAPPKTAPPVESGFAFNLGNALAKLGIDAEGHPRTTSHDPLSNLRSTFGIGDAPAEQPPAEQPPAEQPATEQPATEQPPAERPPADRPPASATVAPAATEPPPALERRQRKAQPSADAAAPPLEVRSRPMVEPDPTVPTRTPPEPPAARADTPPAAVETTGPLPRRGAPVSPAADAAVPPGRSEVTAVAPEPVAAMPDLDELDVAPRPYVSPRRSVFDDVVAPSPSLPPTVVAPSMPRSVTPPTAQPIVPPVAHVAGSPTAATPPIVGAPILPTLPPAPAAPPVPMATTPLDHLDANQATQADLRALRTAQLRAARQSRRSGRVLGRTVLVLAVLGALVGVAFTFGRDLLFPVEWDPRLTPVVDEIQAQRGTDFVHTVGLVVQPDEDFALTATQLTIGDEWVGRIPEWRALGLVAGDPTVAGVAADVASGRLAVYDPATDRVYMPESADPVVAHSDLRVALEQAFDAQLGNLPATPAPATALAGVSSPDVIAQRAVDDFLARRDAGAAPPSSSVRTANLPLPIEYEIVAAHTFGEAVLRAAGADPDTATFATDVSGATATVFDDAAAIAEPAPVQLGERPLGEPVPIGVDDWSLVWGSRLPEATVAQLVPIVIADSYHPVDRSGTTCVSGVFETRGPDDAAVLLAAMTDWVGASPAGAQATVTSLSETRVQLIACDPGPDVAVATSSRSVSALIDRQLVRLAG
jgi:hypothetical protein